MSVLKIYYKKSAQKYTPMFKQDIALHRNIGIAFCISR